MSSKPSIVFYGTPAFAVPSLENLHKYDYEIKAVVTAPDKPSGRGQKISVSAIKEFALENNLKILQPSNLKDESFLQELRELAPDLQVVVAFRMLPDQVWQIPPLGTINLHASLLPEYRGSAPINWAIINGEKETGLTTFFIQRAIDTGRIIFQERTMIGKHETAGDLHDRLMITGAGLLLRTVESIREENLHTVEQSEIKGGKNLKSAPKLNRENTKIDKKQTPEQVCNFIHGLSPIPGAHTQLSNDKGISFSVKIFDALPFQVNHSHPAGTIESDNKSYLHIFLRAGYIVVTELQLSGRNKVKIKDFLNGVKFEGQWNID